MKTHAERREKIATQLLAAMIQHHGSIEPRLWVGQALDCADALIAAVDAADAAKKPEPPAPKKAGGKKRQLKNLNEVD